MGSIDIPPFLRQKMKENIQGSKPEPSGDGDGMEVPDFLKKKEGGEDVYSGQRPSSIPVEKPSYPLRPIESNSNPQLSSIKGNNEEPPSVSNKYNGFFGADVSGAAKNFNDNFENLTGYNSFDLNEPVKPQSGSLRGLVGDDLQKKREESFDDKKKRAYEAQMPKVEGLLNNIYYGTIPADQVEKAIADPVTKNIIQSKVNEIAPEFSDLNNPENVVNAAKKINESNRINYVKAEQDGVFEGDKAYDKIVSELTPLKTKNFEPNFSNKDALSVDLTGSNALVDRINQAQAKVSVTNFDDPTQISNAISNVKDLIDLQSGYYEGDERQQEVEKSLNLYKLLDQRNKFNISKKGISPDISPLNTQIGSAVIGQLSQIDRSGSETDITKDDSAINQFKWGLTLIQNTDPVLYKNITNALSQNKGVAPVDFSHVMGLGQEVSNMAIIRDAATNPSLIGKETNDDYTSYSERKADAARKIAEKLQGLGMGEIMSVPAGMVKKMGKDLGINPNIVNDLAKEEQIPFYNAIPKSGVGNAVVRGVTDLLGGGVDTFMTFGETPAESYLRSKALDLGLFKGQQIPIDGGYSNKTQKDSNSIAIGIAEGAGQFLGQLALTYAAGGLLLGGARAATLGIMNPTGKLAESIIDYGGTALSMYAQTYGGMYEDYLKKTGDPATSKLAANIDAWTQGVIETALPTTKIARAGMKGLRTEFTDGIVDVLKKGGDISALRDKGRSVIRKYAKGVAEVMAVENVEEQAQNLEGVIDEYIFSPQTAKDRNLAKEAWDTFKATTVSLAIPALFGGIGDARTKDFTKSSLHKAAINSKDYISSLEAMRDQGHIDNDEYNNGVKLINTHRQSIESMPVVDLNGDEVDAQKALEYAFEDTKVKIYDDKIKNTTGIQQEMWEIKKKESQKIQRSILMPETEGNAEATGNTTEQKTNNTEVIPNRNDDFIKKYFNEGTPEGEEFNKLSEEDKATAIKKKRAELEQKKGEPENITQPIELTVPKDEKSKAENEVPLPTEKASTTNETVNNVSGKTETGTNETALTSEQPKGKGRFAALAKPKVEKNEPNENLVLHTKDNGDKITVSDVDKLGDMVSPSDISEKFDLSPSKALDVFNKWVDNNGKPDWKPVEGKLIVEPDKPISEMNSEELGNYAQEVKKALAAHDKEFANKTEAEKESGGYYDYIDNVPDLREIEQRLNFIENSEDLSDLASSAKSTLLNIKDKPDEYDMALLNGIRKKAEELNIPTDKLVKEVLKKVGKDYKDEYDAKTMMESVLDKIISIEQLPTDVSKEEGSGVVGDVVKGDNPKGGTWEEVITDKDGLKTTKFKGTRINKSGESVEVETGRAGREMTWDDFLNEFKPSDIDLEGITDRGTPESVTVKELREGADGRNAMTITVDWGRTESGINETSTREIRFDRSNPKTKEEAKDKVVGSGVEKYSEPKRYNSEIEVGQKYYDNRYGDSYVIEKMTPVEGGDVDVTLKYDKGKTRTESGNFLLYHIDAKQHSLSKEQPIVAETPKQEKTNDYYIYDFDNKEFVKAGNAKAVKLDTDGDFFAVKGDNGYYTIHEGTSGQGIGESGKLLRDAIKNANESIERNSKAGFTLDMAVSGGIKRNGKSPRYAEQSLPTQEVKDNTKQPTIKEEAPIVKDNSIVENKKVVPISKGAIIIDSKNGKRATVTRVFKPKKGTPQENEPFLIDVKYEDGRKAINMPRSRYGDNIVENKNKKELLPLINKIKNYAADIIDNREKISRLSEQAEQGRKAGGIRNVEATILLSAGGEQSGKIEGREAQQKAVEDYDAVLEKLDNGEILVNQRDDYRIQSTGEDKYRISSPTKSFETIKTDRKGVEDFLNEKINNYETTATTGSPKSETVTSDIESKAESPKEADLKEVVEKSDKLIDHSVKEIPKRKRVAKSVENKIDEVSRLKLNMKAQKEDFLAQLDRIAGLVFSNHDIPLKDQASVKEEFKNGDRENPFFNNDFSYLKEKGYEMDGQNVKLVVKDDGEFSFPVNDILGVQDLIKSKFPSTDNFNYRDGVSPNVSRKPKSAYYQTALDRGSVERQQMYVDAAKDNISEADKVLQQAKKDNDTSTQKSAEKLLTIFKDDLKEQEAILEDAKIIDYEVEGNPELKTIASELSAPARYVLDAVNKYGLELNKKNAEKALFLDDIESNYGGLDNAENRLLNERTKTDIELQPFRYKDGRGGFKNQSTNSKIAELNRLNNRLNETDAKLKYLESNRKAFEKIKSDENNKFQVENKSTNEELNTAKQIIKEMQDEAAAEDKKITLKDIQNEAAKDGVDPDLIEEAYHAQGNELKPFEVDDKGKAVPNDLTTDLMKSVNNFVDKIFGKGKGGSHIEFSDKLPDDVLGNVDIKTGKIILNKKRINPNTLLHEAGTIWSAWAKENSPELHQRGLELTEKSRYLKRAMDSEFYQSEAFNAASTPENISLAEKAGKEGSKEYNDVLKATPEYNDYMREEALATAIGDKGAQFVSESRKKSFADWAKQLWNNIAKALGFKGVTAKELQNMTLDEFSKRAAKDILDENTQFYKKEKPKTENKPNPNNDNVELYDITHASTANVLDKYGLSERDYSPQTVSEWESEANKRLNKGELEGVIEKIRNGGFVTAVDQVMLAKHIGALAQVAENTMSNKDISALHDAIKLSDSIVGTETARTLRARQIKYINDDSLAAWLIEKKEALNADVLTEDQKQSVKSDFEVIQSIKEKAMEAQKAARIRAENKVMRAAAKRHFDEAEVTIQKDKVKSIISEAKQRIIDKIKAKRKPSGLNFSRSGVDYVRADYITPEIAEDINTILDAHKADGKSYADVIRDTLSDVSDLFENITEQDVIDVLGGKYDNNFTKSQVLRERVDMLREQKILKELDNLEQPPTLNKFQNLFGKRRQEEIVRGKRRSANFKIKDLREELENLSRRTISVHKRLARERVRGLRDQLNDDNADEIQSQIDKEKDHVDSLVPLTSGKLMADELAKSVARIEDKLKKEQEAAHNLKGEELEQKIEQIKQLTKTLNSERQQKDDADIQAKALTDRINLVKQNLSDINARVEEGNFRPEVEPVKVEMTKEEQKLEDELIKSENAHRLQLMKDAYNPTQFQKIANNLNIFRAGMATGDLSGLGRQGALVLTGHPEIAAAATKFMLQSAVSEKLYERWLYNVKTKDPRYKDMMSLRLALTDMKDPNLTKHEEAFQSDILEKIPLYSHLYKGSERAYSGVLNKMRVDLYNYFADKLESQGKTPENSEKEYKWVTSYINTITGRGKLHPKIENAAPFLNALFFSPRLVAARLNSLSYWARPDFWRDAPKEIRVAYFADMLKFAAVGVSIMGLASLYSKYGGGDDDDKWSVDFFTPTSADFGKVKINNTRVDVWAGFQQYITLAARLAAGYTTTHSGKQMKFGEGYKADTRLTVLLKGVRSKANPILGMGMDLVGGEDFIGNKIKYDWTLGQPEKNKEMGIDRYMVEHILPMSITGSYEALQDVGWKVGVPLTVMNVIGWGTQTYDTSSMGDASEKLLNAVNPDYKRTSDEGFLPPKVGPTFTLDNHSIKLKDKDYKEFTDMVNEAREKTVLKVVEKKSYQKATDSKRKMMLREYYKEGRESAKELFLKKHTEFKKQVEAKAKEEADEEKRQKKLRR